MIYIIIELNTHNLLLLFEFWFAITPFVSHTDFEKANFKESEDINCIIIIFLTAGL